MLLDKRFLMERETTTRNVISADYLSRKTLEEWEIVTKSIEIRVGTLLLSEF